MFSSDELDNYADILIWGLKTSRRTPFSSGDVVLLRFDAQALPLAEAVYARLLDLRVHPVLRLNPTAGMERSFFDLSSYNQLVFQAPGEQELMERLNGVISLLAPEALTHLSGANPEDIALTQVARKPLRDIMQRREEEGSLGWTLCLYPTPALAAAAGLSLEDYAAQIRAACLLDHSQPVHDWTLMWCEMQEIKAWLSSLDILSLHVESACVDVRLTLGQSRRFIGLTGHNIPSFEVYVSPDWRGTDGVYFADLPTFRSGNLIRGVRLTFEDGRLTAAGAEEGQDFVQRQLAMDPGASRVGEFSLTDRRFSRIDHFMAHTLFDENFGGAHGNCHLALGGSYADTYAGDPATLTTERKETLGFNASALHWDLVNTEDKRVRAKLAGGSTLTIYENGQFVR